MDKRARAVRNVKAASSLYYLLAIIPLLIATISIAAGAAEFSIRFFYAIFSAIAILVSAYFVRKHKELAAYITPCIYFLSFAIDRFSGAYRQVGTFGNPRYIGSQPGAQPNLVDVYPVSSVIAEFIPTVLTIVVAIVAVRAIRYLKSNNNFALPDVHSS